MAVVLAGYRVFGFGGGRIFQVAKTERKNEIMDMPGKRHCPDCGGEHEFYIKGCPHKSWHRKLNEENARLRARCGQLENLAELQTEIYETLDWMIGTLEFQNRNTGMNAEDSPEMKAAKILRAKLKPESD